MHAEGITNALRQEPAEADRGFDRAGHSGAGFGNTDMQRVVGLSGEQIVGIDRVMHVRSLERHLHVGETLVFERVHGI